MELVTSLEDLQVKLEKVDKQISNLYKEKLAEEIDANMFKTLSLDLQKDKESYEKALNTMMSESSRLRNEELDLDKIRSRLDTYVDFSGSKVCDEMLDMFVDRVIRRSNEEYLWVLNLSGIKTDTRSYRIKEYSEEHSNILKSDDNFDVIYKFLISTEECKKFVESDKVNKKFFAKFWKPMTVKIAIK